MSGQYPYPQDPNNTFNQQPPPQQPGNVSAWNPAGKASPMLSSTPNLDSGASAPPRGYPQPNTAQMPLQMAPQYGAPPPTYPPTASAGYPAPVQQIPPQYATQPPPPSSSAPPIPITQRQQAPLPPPPKASASAAARENVNVNGEEGTGSDLGLGNGTGNGSLPSNKDDLNRAWMGSTHKQPMLNVKAGGAGVTSAFTGGRRVYPEMSNPNTTQIPSNNNTMATTTSAPLPFPPSEPIPPSQAVPQATPVPPPTHYAHPQPPPPHPQQQPYTNNANTNTSVTGAGGNYYTAPQAQAQAAPLGQTTQYTQPLATQHTTGTGMGVGGQGVSSPYGQYQQPNTSEFEWDHAHPPRVPRRGAPVMSTDAAWDLPMSRSCDRKFMALTMNACPSSSGVLKDSALPFGICCKPMAEWPGQKAVSVVNFEGTVIRCRRCRAYINPFVEWIEGGRRWRCNMCFFANECPADYYCPLDANGVRRDLKDRPELKSGSVEYVAPSEYMVRPPQPPLFFFMIDVSYASVSSGVLQKTCEAVLECIHDLPGDERTQFGLMTFDSAIHFYSLRSEGGGGVGSESDGEGDGEQNGVQMMVVSDVDDPFLPQPMDLIVNLHDNKDAVVSLLEKLPSIHADTQCVESCLGSALQLASEVTSNIGGRIMLFQVTRPSLGKGKLRQREDASVLGSEVESKLLRCDDDWYKTLAVDLSRLQLSVELFVFSGQHTDIATLGTLPKFTGGEIHYFPMFDLSVHYEAFRNDVVRTLTRTTCWESVIRLRFSKGVRAPLFHGHFFVRNSDLLAVPVQDADKSYVAQLVVEDMPVSQTVFCVQSACLYTSSDGERRIRVHNLCVPVTSNVTDLYKAADEAVIAHTLMLSSIDSALTTKLSDGRDNILSRMIEIMRAYRVHCQQSRNSGKLCLPSSLGHLPLIALSFVKHAVLRAGKDVPLDNRVVQMNKYKINHSIDAIHYTVPDLYRIDTLHTGGGESECVVREESVENGVISCIRESGQDLSNTTPPRLNLSMKSLSNDGVYLLDNGVELTILVGKSVDATYLRDVFGVESQDAIVTNIKELTLIERNNEASFAFWELVRKLRGLSVRHLPLHIVGSQDVKARAVFDYMVEDRSSFVMSYSEYLAYLHQQASGV